MDLPGRATPSEAPTPLPISETPSVGQGNEVTYNERPVAAPVQGLPSVAATEASNVVQFPIERTQSAPSASDLQPQAKVVTFATGGLSKEASKLMAEKLKVQQKEGWEPGLSKAA